MPRPKGSMNKTKGKGSRKPKSQKEIIEISQQKIDKQIDDNKQIACFGCNKLKAKKLFYMSYNPLHLSGRLPYCIECLKSMICDDKGIVTLDKLKDTLQKVDLPFIYNLWQTSMEEEGDSFGIYKKNLSLPQARFLTWKHSVFLPEIHNPLNYENAVEVIKEEEIVDEDMKIKWGKSYDAIQITRLEKFYNEMITTHFITTPQHRQILKFICKMNLKMDECLEADDLGNFTKLSQQYDKLLQTSGLRPIDKTSSNVDIGIKNFSTIFEEVEKDGFIKPASIEENQDIVDKTIMYIMNYTLKLLNFNQLTSPPLDTPKVKGGKKSGKLQ